MKREYVILGGLVLLLVCEISRASKNRKQMPRSSEEEPPDQAALEKEAYMKQLQHEIEMRQQNPFLCLPKYLCIVQGESGQKKTAVLSSLRPIPHSILKQQQNSGPFPFPVQHQHPPPRNPKPTPSSTSDESKEKEEKESESIEDDLDYSGSNEDFGLNRDDVLTALAVDRVKNNGTETGVMGKLKTLLMPSFKMPSLPTISMPMPSLSLFKGSEDKNGNNGDSTNGQLNGGVLKRRKASFFGRMKRQAEESEEIHQSQEDLRNDTRFRTPEQCQLLFSGCELSYDEIMSIANSGAVVIENDGPSPPPPFTSPQDPGYARPPKRRKPIKIEDDELDQFLREQAQKRQAEKRRKTKRPYSNKYYSNYHPSRPQITIPNALVVHELHPGEVNQLLYPTASPTGAKKPSPVKLQQLQHAQEFLTQNSKYGSTTSFYNKNKPLKHKPNLHDDDVDNRNPTVGLPILPVRLQWGRPVQIGNQYVRPFHKNHFQQASPAPFYTTTTQPPPIFSKIPVDKKPSSNIPIFANRTHQAILKAKPYHPFHVPRTKQFDKFGRPVSYASVFTEVAGSSGGVHDYFDKIASTIGENIIKTEQDLLNSNKKKKRVSRRKKNRVTAQSATAKPIDSDEDKDETTKEEDDPENTTKEDDKDAEKDADDDVEEEEDTDEGDETDDTDVQDDHKKKNKYNEEKEILAILPSFMQEAIHNDRIRRKNKRKKKKKNKNNKDEIARTYRRRGEALEGIEYVPITITPPSKQTYSPLGFFKSFFTMMKPKRKQWSSQSQQHLRN